MLSALESEQIFDAPTYFSFHRSTPGVLTTAGLEGIEDHAARRDKLGHYFLDHFHAYWSDFIASFVTEPMDLGGVKDSAEPTGVHWFAAAPKDLDHPHYVQGIDTAIDSLTAVLLCGVCDDDRNVCMHDGICVEGACECSIGSSGSLCQIPPVGNGRCDPKFDIPKYGKKKSIHDHID